MQPARKLRNSGEYEMTYASQKKMAFKWGFAIILAVITLRLFLVQQLIAAFIIFSGLFACLASALFLVFAVGHITQAAMCWTAAWTAACLNPLAHTGTGGANRRDAVVMGQLDRPSRISSQKQTVNMYANGRTLTSALNVTMPPAR